MARRKNKALLHNLRQITLVTIVNILHVTAKYEKAEKVNMFNILLWTPMGNSFFDQMPLGSYSFTEPKCQYQNCYLTNNPSYLSNIRKFDAVLFDFPALGRQHGFALPKQRSLCQRYVLVSTESPVAHPIKADFNNFFNWTWTYKLDSDVVIANIAIRDAKGTIIGPRNDMHWLAKDKMKASSTDTLSKLTHKRTAAIWLVTNCEPNSQPRIFIQKLQDELRNYNHSLDFYGNCPNANYGVCSMDFTNKKKLNRCDQLTEKKYYFYLSFENILSADLVSAHLLTALQHYSVPVVYGGANYTKFMPSRIYLDALELGPEKLAKTMDEIITDRSSYEEMFSWHRYYSYHDPRNTPDTNSFCAFCAALNERQNEHKVYKNIVKWFNERPNWSSIIGSARQKRSEGAIEDAAAATTKPKPYVAINIKYPPRPTPRPSPPDDDTCTGLFTCLRSSFITMWNLMRIEW